MILKNMMFGLGMSFAALSAPMFVESVSAAPETSHVLWYNSDAGTTFTNALPIGNGYMGGMVYGGVSKDVINLNEGTVWNSGPGSNNKSGSASKLGQIRNALFSGDYKTAEDMTGSFSTYDIAKFQPVGDLILNFGHTGTDYRRELDLETATAKTTYTSGGVKYTREYFASYPDNVIVVRISADANGKVNFDASFTCPHTNKSIKNVGSDGLTLDATINSIKFQSRFVIKADGGKVSAGNGSVKVEGANSAYIILNTGTNFVSFNNVTANPGERAAAAVDAASKKTYDQLKSAHLKDYQELYNRVRLNLGSAASNAGDITSSRVKAFNTTDDPSFVELYYQFGRYLMISCSRKGGQPANLQGIWNNEMNPSWGSKYTTNINLEMNYWMVESANLQECGVPLFDKIKALVTQGSKSAKEIWGTDRGWVVHHNTDLWNRTGPVDGSWGVWPSGAGWLSTHLWEHYLYTGDKQFLKDAYETMKGAAEFYLTTMVEEPKSGHKYLVTAPSDSPENTHGGYNVCFGPTMDIQIARDAFNNAIEASKILGVDEDLRADFESAVKRLPPNQIGKYGQLMEWFEDWDDPRSDHRHVSHLYGLFPSAQISVDGTKDEAEAAKTTLTQRGDNATGWSLAWKINLWARLQDGDHAYKLVRNLLTPDRTYNNLFDAHPPFQIDGNFGAVSGINEMFIQSQGGKIRVLPALPSKWSSGSIAGLKARGGVTVDSLAWNNGKLTYLGLSSTNKDNLTIEYNGNIASTTTMAGGKYEFDGNLKLTNEPFEAVALPAKIEAEDYVAMDGVVIEPDESGEPNIGWIEDGDWSEYFVKAPSAGRYNLKVRVASGSEEKSTITVANEAGKTLGTITVDPAKTKGWNDWYEEETELELPAGEQTLRFTFNGTGFLMNVDNFSLDPVASDGISVASQSVNSLEVSRMPMSRASIALMVKAPAGESFTVRLLDMDGRQVAISRGLGGTISLVEFGASSLLPQGNYIAIVKSGSFQKTLRVSAY
ncbi:alpha-L-fucosidase 2 [Fibrobacter sp. UWR4]|uniref:glycosyl hydrolase family 95 catalytic domain-containing protein n=1 Tax=Fibrobacter sp. UWR4 TaxID=1896218 RepID=UPI000D6B480B|nr:glycoside hydrolase N-terminal domain-containing protein [Fibrobacter sp. UWR4]PWJ61880.1 alpha-L-fucosidase 2 [Fibrobacter sp. UWR4]